MRDVTQVLWQNNIKKLVTLLLSAFLYCTGKTHLKHLNLWDQSSTSGIWKESLDDKNLFVWKP